MAPARVIGTSIAAIQAAESELGRRLPESFTQWLLVNNGRSPGALTVFPVFDARDPRKTWDSIVRQYQEGWQVWLENVADSASDCSALLPFAEFGTGDYYCFDYAVAGAAGEPVVVLWSHESGATQPVADSFTVFMQLHAQPVKGVDDER